MKQEALLHVPDSSYCFATSLNEVTLRLRTAKGEKFDRVAAVYGNKYTFQSKQLRAPMAKKYSDFLFDYYEARLTLDDVRLVYVFELILGGKPYYFSEDGVSGSYDFSLAYYNSFQLPYINAADVHECVPWMKSAVFYEIFVDRFNRGDYKKDDGYITLKWGEIPHPKSFAGGDIKGITGKLEYLSDLGVNALYLTPVFAASSNHKYDISDYYKIDPQFGSKEDLKELVRRAHRLGMRVVLDAVFNHCSENLEQFKDVTLKGKSSRYYEWFMIDGDFPDKQTGNYECFAACRYMPKFNTSHPQVRSFLCDVGVYWIEECGIDGWRLDVSDEVSHAFWREFRRRVKAVQPACVIIGENWHDARPFLRGEEYDSIMNYSLTKACLDFFAFRTLDSQGLSAKLSALLMRNTDTVNDMMLNLLDSHDTHRFITQVNGNEAALEAALALIYCFKGAPCLYYGTEIALPGGYDPDCRRTMDWKAAEAQTPLKELIRSLSKLKSTHPALTDGDAEFGAEGDVFTLCRSRGGCRLRLAINGGENSVEFSGRGKALLSHGYEDGRLLPFGFVIEEERGS